MDNFQFDTEKLAIKSGWVCSGICKQVFFSTQNDHICTRMEHVQHVASVSYTIANYLGLNPELTQAIALGHDIGHAPFGHAGEEHLNEIAKKDLNEEFWHEKNGVYVCDLLATQPDDKGDLKNLNLTYAVRDGIISHCGEINENGINPRDESVDLYSIKKKAEFQPYTWEGCVVKIADKIAYLGRDIEDASELGLIQREELMDYKKIIKRYSNLNVTLNNTVLMHNLIVNLCENSSPQKGLCFSGDFYKLINDVRELNYNKIYLHSKIEYYKQFSKTAIDTIYRFLKKYYPTNNNNISESLLINIKKDKDGQKYPLLIKYFEEWIIKYSNIDLKEKKIARYRFENKIVYDFANEKDYYRAILDFIAGMTDNFVIKVYNEIISF
jgi:dGTPase